MDCMRSLWFFLIFALATAWAMAQGPDDQFRLEVNASLVSVDVGVYDRNEKPVTDLGKDDFRIYEDGVLQRIKNFTPVSGGYRILLLIDHSGSMRTAWSFLLDGLNLFMKNLRPQDQVAIATFDQSVQVAMDWRSAKAGNTEQIGIAPNGMGTEIWSSLNWAVREVSHSDGRKGVIVFTDGQDRGDGYDKALERAIESEIPFYFVGLTTENSTGGSRMKKFASETGGKSYFPRNPSELGPLYASIARDLGTSYTISYAPSKPPGDNKLRRIEIRPIDTRLHLIQSRTGYYAK
jgi:Ca-activated chloride channel family protein